MFCQQLAPMHLSKGRQMQDGWVCAGIGCAGVQRHRQYLPERNVLQLWQTDHAAAQLSLEAQVRGMDDCRQM